ncbi:MAG: dhbF, partial [Geminicoccaceae bacterium]|nr:dhbF [Geminicoccaceae bacterium]
MQRRLIALAANFTAEPVSESLGFWLTGVGLPCDVEHAPFDQVFQQLLDPASLLGANRGGANVILVRLDLWLDPRSGQEGAEREGGAAFQRKVEELADALRSACGRCPAPHVAVWCPADPGRLRDPGVAASLAQAEQWLSATLAGTPNLQLITSDDLLAAHGSVDYFDAESDAIGRIPYSESLFATVGTLVARRVRAALAVPYKVVVLDCDNTLWGGVVGEAGPHGIGLDDAFGALQRFMVRQHETGMLVCLCSKNNEADVREVFRLRPEMPLTWAHVTSARINWEPKSANLRALAAELGLGLSSFVFIDDSPYEIAEVRRNCPEVLALQLPSDAAAIHRFIEHAWFFDRTAVTDADRLRAASYAQNARRNEIRRQATSLDDFLRDLELRIAITAPAADALDRAAQLTQRTNQFNLSTQRRTTAELNVLLSSGAMQARIVDVRDRFGEYGIVGLLLFETRGDAIRVDTFLLSCRVLGRRVEHHMLAHLGALARELGVARIELPFRHTPKNMPALRFLTSVTRDAASAGSDHLFVLTADASTAALALPASDPG